MMNADATALFGPMAWFISQMLIEAVTYWPEVKRFGPRCMICILQGATDKPNDVM